MTCVVQSWCRKVRRDEALGVSCAVPRPAERALRRRAAVYVLATAAAVGCNSNPLYSGPGPDLTGTWRGSTTGVMLSIGLGKSTCEAGAYGGCTGLVTGGSYRDSVTGVQGTFTPATPALCTTAVSCGSFSLYPPMGSAPNSAPLPGWRIVINPVDTTKLVQPVNVYSTFSSATAMAGLVVFRSDSVGAPEHDVTITLVKQ